MNVNVTLEVPTSVYRLAKKTAEVTSRRVEQVLVDVLASASPISDDLPPELQAELDTLAQMSDNELWRIARGTFPNNRRRQYDLLLEKNSAGKLTESERDTLHQLRAESDRLMLQKAHAFALLKWRGSTLPALSKIPRPR